MTTSPAPSLVGSDAESTAAFDAQIASGPGTDPRMAKALNESPPDVMYTAVNLHGLPATSPENIDFKRAWLRGTDDPADRVLLEMELAAIDLPDQFKAVPTDPNLENPDGLGLLTAAVMPHAREALELRRVNAAKAIRAIEQDPDLRGEAGAQIRARKLAALVSARKKEVSDGALGTMFEREIQNHLKTFLPRRDPTLLDQFYATTALGTAAAHWPPEDFLEYVEHSAFTSPELGGPIRAQLKRLIDAPPRAWRDSSPDNGKARLDRAAAILARTPIGTHEREMRRWRQAQKEAVESRKAFAKQVATFVRFGK